MAGADFEPRERVPLAPFTTLELGGEAEFFAEALDETQALRAVAWADKRGVPLHVLGGGSNALIPDGGLPGLVLHMANRGIFPDARGAAAGKTALRVGAGEMWDDFVAHTVEHGLAGVECLSGIPGLVGASPIQNVGAYGQEVHETIRRVRVYDRQERAVRSLSDAECEFAYRNSALKRQLGRYIVLEVTFELIPGGAPAIRYAELQKHVEPNATLSQIREKVIELRRRKSMVIDPSDENRRSAGSFFTNPILPDADALRVMARAVELGVVENVDEVPRYPGGEGRTKLAAAWLIEKSGVQKGETRGNVGVSSRHTLALVHHGGGSTAELLAFADDVRRRVLEVFDVSLEREPVLLG